MLGMSVNFETFARPNSSTLRKKEPQMTSIYDFTVKDNQGNDVKLSEFEGDVLLIVNTATGCGFTPQYEGLEKLYEEFKDQGFEILDFPCNQFGNQAPGTDEEIASFCSLNYNTQFLRFSKIDVNGPNTAPLYAYLKKEAPDTPPITNAADDPLAQYIESQKSQTPAGDIVWNFEKFLVDRKGNVVAHYLSIATPEEIAPEIKKLLAE